VFFVPLRLKTLLQFHKKSRLKRPVHLSLGACLSSAHDPATGRTILDQAFSTFYFCGAIFRGSHSAASAFLGHMVILF
jgi:hypothetical protein